MSYFFYQKDGGEDAWKLELAAERERIIRDVKPRYTSVLNLSGVPDNNDWSTTRYDGPFYIDIDAEGDLDFACSQFRALLGKLETEFDFNVFDYYGLI